MQIADLGIQELHRADGRWLVDCDLLMQVLWRTQFSKALEANWSKGRMPKYGRDTSFTGQIQSTLFEWFEPDLYTETTSMEQVKIDATEKSTHEFYDIMTSKNINGIDTKQRVINLIKTGNQSKNQYLNRRRDLSRANHKEIQSVVDKYDIAISGSQTIRDTSIDVFIGSATIATGGAGLSLLAVSGGSGVLKGLAKYQDTNNVGAAMITGAISATTTVIKLPMDKMKADKLLSSKADKIGAAMIEGVVIVLEGVGEATSDMMVMGKAADTAFLDASINQLTKLGAGAVMNKSGLKDPLEKIVRGKGFKTPIPISTAAGKFAHHLATTAVESSIGAIIDRNKIAKAARQIGQGENVATVGHSTIDLVDQIFQKAG